MRWRVLGSQSSAGFIRVLLCWAAGNFLSWCCRRRYSSQWLMFVCPWSVYCACLCPYRKVCQIICLEVLSDSDCWKLNMIHTLTSTYRKPAQPPVRLTHAVLVNVSSHFNNLLDCSDFIFRSFFLFPTEPLLRPVDFILVYILKSFSSIGWWHGLKHLHLWRRDVSVYLITGSLMYIILPCSFTMNLRVWLNVLCSSLLGILCCSSSVSRGTDFIHN